MPVRLNKALKELNVGINTVAEFLQKKGMALEDATPNAKITDEQYNALVNAFVADKDKNKETRLDIQKRKERESQEKAERKEKERQAQAIKEAELKKQQAAQDVFRLNTEKKPEFKVLGNINDKKKTAEATENKAAEAKPVASLSSLTNCQPLNASRKLIYPGFPFNTSTGRSFPSSMKILEGF